MEKFDLTIYGQRGNVRLLECTKFPTKEQMDKYLENFNKLGIGKARRFVFDNIK